MSNIREQMLLVVILIFLTIAFSISVMLNFQLQKELNTEREQNSACYSDMEDAHDFKKLEHEMQSKIESYGVGSKKASRLAPVVLRYAEEHRIDPNLLVAQIYVESAFKAKARSYMGASGLMQVMPFWTRSHYIEKCGGLERGLACYNGGYRALHSPKPETIAYVKKVLKYYRA